IAAAKYSSMANRRRRPSSCGFEACRAAATTSTRSSATRWATSAPSPTSPPKSCPSSVTSSRVQEESVTNDIQVYGADWCGLTRGIREYLVTSRLEYDYFDVDRDEAAQQFVLETNDGRRRLPVVVVEERVLLQPTNAVLQGVLREQGIEAPVRRARAGRSER